MIVSTKGRYALRVMIDLAEHQTERYVPLKEVAARQEISEKYLENILKVLVQNGFLEGLRGKGGGYRLTRSPDQYTVAEILVLTEGNLAPVSCLAPGARPLRADGKLPHLQHVEGPERPHHQLLRQHHHRGPRRARRSRERLRYLTGKDNKKAAASLKTV